MNIYIKLLMVCFALLWIIFFTPAPALAQEYVLPYPGFMPGHPLYKVSQIIDQIQEWWSFGSFSKFKYHLASADKKLIEAKTLFEYKQYLLASQAINSYVHHLDNASYYLNQAGNENKNITDKKMVFSAARAKHLEILQQLKTNLPAEFLWLPEKAKPQPLKIRELIESAIK